MPGVRLLDPDRVRDRGPMHQGPERAAELVEDVLGGAVGVGPGHHQAADPQRVVVQVAPDSEPASSNDPQRVVVQQQFPATGFRLEKSLLFVSHVVSQSGTIPAWTSYSTTWADGEARHVCCSR
jgi:hypothetical protein